MFGYYFIIDKVYTITGLDINDGNIMYKQSHHKFIPVNRTQINKHQRAIGFESPQRVETLSLDNYQNELVSDNLS